MKMKNFYVLLMIVFLASCGTKEVQETQNVPETSTKIETDQAVENVLAEIEQEITQEIENVEQENEDYEDKDEDEDEKDSEEEWSEGETETEVQEATESTPKVVKIQHSYQNPKQTVIMDIEYSVDDEGKITDIDVSSENYAGLAKSNFDEGVKKTVIGLTLDEVQNIDTIGGSSLTTYAFKQALKEDIKK